MPTIGAVSGSDCPSPKMSKSMMAGGTHTSSIHGTSSVMPNARCARTIAQPLAAKPSGLTTAGSHLNALGGSVSQYGPR